MEPIKIVIFVAAFLLLVLLGRIISSGQESQVPFPHEPETPMPAGGQEIGSTQAGTDDDEEYQGPGPPAKTGAELGFPITLPPVVRDSLGKYNRPHLLDYYFAKIDMVRGPADPACFCDQFFLRIQYPDDQNEWTYEYTVATPSGLRRVMETERFASLYFDTPVVIVDRWDLPVVLRTVTDELFKNYQTAHNQTESDTTLEESGG